MVGVATEAAALVAEEKAVAQVGVANKAVANEAEVVMEAAARAEVAKEVGAGANAAVSVAVAKEVAAVRLSVQESYLLPLGSCGHGFVLHLQCARDLVRCQSGRTSRCCDSRAQHSPLRSCRTA